MDAKVAYFVVGDYRVRQLTRLDHENKPMRHNISLGGQKKGCIVIEVDEKETGYHANSEIAHINSIQYDKRCNNSGDMIRVAMQVTCYLCPWVTSFSLRDASARLCMPDGPEVNLSDLYICLYGKTWYEHHFDARIQSDEYHELYRQLLRKLKSKRLRTICQSFTDKNIY